MVLSLLGTLYDKYLHGIFKDSLWEITQRTLLRELWLLQKLFKKKSPWNPFGELFGVLLRTLHQSAFLSEIQFWGILRTYDRSCYGVRGLNYFRAHCFRKIISVRALGVTLDERWNRPVLLFSSSFVLVFFSVCHICSFLLCNVAQLPTVGRWVFWGKRI